MLRSKSRDRSSSNRVQSGSLGASNNKSSAVLLADKWESGKDPTGWYMSEKLDGVRGYWDGF